MVTPCSSSSESESGSTSARVLTSDRLDWSFEFDVFFLVGHRQVHMNQDYHSHLKNGNGGRCGRVV